MAVLPQVPAVCVTCGSCAPCACHAFCPAECCLSRCAESARKPCTSAWPVVSPSSSPPSPVAPPPHLTPPHTHFVHVDTRQGCLKGRPGCRHDLKSAVARAGDAGARPSRRRPSTARGVAARPRARGGQLRPSEHSQPGPVLGSGVETGPLPARGWQPGSDPAPTWSASSPGDLLREQVTHSRHFPRGAKSPKRICPDAAWCRPPARGDPFPHVDPRALYSGTAEEPHGNPANVYFPGRASASLTLRRCRAQER